MSTQRLAEMYPELRGYIEDFVDWAPVVLFDTNALGAAAIPDNTQFFNAAPANAICNLDRVNEVNYRTIVLGWSYQVITITGLAPTHPTIADALVFFEECELELVIDGDNKPSWPACAVPGGGGINWEQANIAAGAATSHASNGLGNQWRYFLQPYVIEPKQTFAVFLRSLAATPLVVATDCRICLVGIEARRPL